MKTKIATTALKFERIQAFPMNAKENIPANHFNGTTIDLGTVWKTKKFFNNVPVLYEKCNEHEVNSSACRLFEMCARNLTTLLMEVDEKLTPKHPQTKTNYNLLNLHRTWSEFISVQVAFYGGLFLGAMLGAIVLFTLKLISDCVSMSGCQMTTELKDRRRRRKNDCFNFEHLT